MPKLAKNSGRVHYCCDKRKHICSDRRYSKEASRPCSPVRMTVSRWSGTRTLERLRIGVPANFLIR
jgi:hypothetical protein